MIEREIEVASGFHVELTPDDPNPIDTLALIYFEQHEYSRAIDHARRCTELFPGRPHFQQQLHKFKTAAEQSAKDSNAAP